MCLHVFVGSLLLTETERLFPSLMLSSEVGCQHLCRQRNGEAEKKNSERCKGKAYFFARPDKNKNLRLLTVCPHTISKRRYLFRLCHKSDGCLSGFIQVTLIGLPTMALPKMWAERNFSLGVFCEMREYEYLCHTERVIWSYAKRRRPKHSVYC